jgi:hypothetical protein
MPLKRRRLAAWLQEGRSTPRATSHCTITGTGCLATNSAARRASSARERSVMMSLEGLLKKLLGIAL